MADGVFRGPRPVAVTGGGTVGGVAAGPGGAVAAFRGVPYAASPTGELRLAPPQPYPVWAGVREAAEPGPSAPQPPSRLEHLTVPRTPDWDEDGCLTLNVFTPAAALATGARPRPVLLWFHGGAFTSGSGGWDWYDGANLAALGDAVVVTANYRLGPLGWLWLPQLGARNLGAQDQAAALRWVHTNATAFGGDPSRITVGGQSAGALSAVALAADPATGPLVHRVLAQSGPFGCDPLDQQEASRSAGDLMALLDLPAADDPALPGLLRALPTTELLDAYRELAARPHDPDNILPPMVPVLGGPGYPRTLRDAAHEGALDGKPLLIGTTTDEMTAFGAHGEQGRALTARIFTQASEAIADACATRGGEVFAYRFDRRPHPDLAGFGATHCAELPFLFGTFDTYDDSPMLGLVDSADQALARSFAGAIAAFVHGRAPWPARVPDRPHTQHLDRPISDH